MNTSNIGWETIDFDYVEKNVQGPVDREELQFLAIFAEKVPENGVIVDIGTSGGRSAFTLAVSSKKTVKVYTIDPKISPSFFKKREHLKLQDKVIDFKIKSQALYQNWNRPIDLIFIDGDHAYETVKEDIEGWCTLVKRGGFCLFHDYHGPSPIKKAVDEVEGKIFKKEGMFKLVYAGEKI